MKFAKYLSWIILLIFGGSPFAAGDVSSPGVQIKEDLDTAAIEKSLSVPLRILKHETIGRNPIHVFLWACSDKDANRGDIENSAQEVVKAILLQQKEHFHSITIHFYRKADLKKSIANSKSHAKAMFLPEGDWSLVGRVLIDGYRTYRLTCIFFE